MDKQDVKRTINAISEEALVLSKKTNELLEKLQVENLFNGFGGTRLELSEAAEIFDNVALALQRSIDSFDY